MTVAGSGKRWAGTGERTDGKGKVGLAVAVTGVPEIDRRLKQLEKKVQKKVITQAMRAGMKIIQKDVKARARKVFAGPGSKSTGATVRGVKVRATKRSRKRFGIDVRINGGAYVDKTFYAAFHEYGTRRMKARPIMAPSFRANGKAVRDEILRLTLAGVERETRTLARWGG